MKRQEKQPAETEMVKTTLRLPLSLSNRLKHAAIDAGISAQELVQLALETYLGKQKGGRP